MLSFSLSAFFSTINTKLQKFLQQSPLSLCIQDHMFPSLSPMEARQRSSVSIEEMNKRRLPRSKVKDIEKPFHIPIQDKSVKCKFHPLKLVLLIIIFATFVTFLQTPWICHHDHIAHSVSRLIWGATDLRYIPHLDIDWDEISKVIDKIENKNKIHGIGLLNFNKIENNHWKQVLPIANHTVLHLDYAEQNVTWDSLYPEWIDEEQEEDVPICPSLPKLDGARKRLDLIAVKLPCRNEGNWSRDVARLHLQLAAAELAASAKGSHPVHLLFVTKCFPIPNLFTCKELVKREGNAWLYEPNLNVLREKLQLPVGSCELALPLKAEEPTYSGNVHREAYATILHSAHVYVCGAIAAAQSIRMAGSTRDLVILVDSTISTYHRSGLEAAGWKIRTIQRIRNPKAEKDAYNEWNYSKFRLWQLTDYDKIIFIDADMLILRNIDFLFGMPEISATGNNGTLFNSGVMVIEPSNCTFQLLMDHINEIESYNGGDQGYLNEIFTWWHRIPKHINFLKHFWIGDEEAVKRKKTWLFGAEPPVLYVLHYLGVKPWLCFRDYDCNWNMDIFQEFASDVAHKKWWKVHDAMPEPLHQFCMLQSKQKAQLEWDRREAEKANYTDGHWRIKVQDRRLKKCIDNLCNWKSMLRHWGETNWTDDEAFTPTPPAITMSSLSGL
ncbi:UDP-glucuronate:xylan alpha-glucuronosyltransferase 1-like isoform X2 [Cornus florida]|uniref:UDP-glucuronate:xylan alpha-glucuronosyltransferase 1-like isoform X2 n=1 Tax=Cornus florida TaxID=4283 RepID=UPI0028A1F012|nr:UDP-glucuronate:xylan alpha-glucuronosyltransferase 1-like isoform X2 [Cornus florida]